MGKFELSHCWNSAAQELGARSVQVIQVKRKGGGGLESWDE